MPCYTVDWVTILCYAAPLCGYLGYVSTRALSRPWVLYIGLSRPLVGYVAWGFFRCCLQRCRMRIGMTALMGSQRQGEQWTWCEYFSHSFRPRSQSTFASYVCKVSSWGQWARHRWHSYGGSSWWYLTSCQTDGSTTGIYETQVYLKKRDKHTRTGNSLQVSAQASSQASAPSRSCKTTSSTSSTQRKILWSRPVSGLVWGRHWDEATRTIRCSETGELYRCDTLAQW